MTPQNRDERLEAWLQFAHTLRLVSLDPRRDRARVYTFTWQPTLWGEFALIRHWGRLERPTRSVLTLYPDRSTSAQADLRRLLRRRLQHGYQVVVCC